MSYAVTALRVADEGFLVTSTIERCPKVMMIRELMMNALEAARLAAPDNRRVEISASVEDAVEKLAIWNTGPGMDGPELLRICDIASSIGKEKSLTGNFGMGAKVASLPSNQHGMRYRSCKDGRVHEVILCKRDGIYGRLRRRDQETSEYLEVIDVTEIAQGLGRPLEYDWTEVVLLGNDADQNTVKDPFNGDPTQDVQWLATYLYHRFYRLPDGVKVVLLKGTNKLDGNRHFQPISARGAVFDRHETVETPSGIKVHYIYDAPYENSVSHNRSISGAIASAVSTCAIVYKDEMYDVRKGKNWTFDAPIFGIPFGAKHISVHVEIPTSAPVVPEGYRQFLRHTQGEQSQVQVSDFADFVREHRPQWLIEIIQSFAPDSASSDDIRNELQKLLNQLRVKRVSPKLVVAGDTNVANGEGPASGVERGTGEGRETESDQRRQKPTDLSVLPTGAKRAEMFKNLERAPEIIPLDDEDQIEEKGLKGRAGRYVMTAGQLFVNMRYPSIEEMRTQLEAEYATTKDTETMRALVKQLSEQTMILRIGRTVVYALAKQLNKEWDQKALDTASSPESLSMAADDYHDSMQNVRRAVGKALRTKREATEVAA